MSMIIRCNSDLPKSKQYLSTAILTDDGELFASADFHPAGEMGGFLCAGWDATTRVINYEDHAYMPVSWLKEENKNDPEILEVLDKIIAASKEAPDE